jgi:septal ring-binding cell division protein DamX
MQDFPTQGPIDGLFLPRLVASLHLDEFEGMLRLTFPDATKILYFKRGEIASAASNAEPDRLANILIQEGRLGTEQLDLARNNLPAGASLGKTLIDMGFLSPSELLQGARRQVRLIVVSCFQAMSGAYEMVPGPLPPEVTSLGLNTRRLVFDCLQDAGDRAAVIREIGSMESVYRPTERLPQALSVLRLDPETDRVARLLDGSATLRDISSRTSLDDFTVGKVVLALDLLRAAERVGPAAGAVAARPAEPASVASMPAASDVRPGRTIPVEMEPDEAPGPPPETADATDEVEEIVILDEDADEAAQPLEIMPAPPLPAPIEESPVTEAAPADPPPIPADELPAFAQPIGEEPRASAPQWQVDPETGERVHAGPIEMTFDGQVGGHGRQAQGLARFLAPGIAVAVVVVAAFAFLILRRGTSAPETPVAIAEAQEVAAEAPAAAAPLEAAPTPAPRAPAAPLPSPAATPTPEPAVPVPDRLVRNDRATAPAREPLVAVPAPLPRAHRAVPTVDLSGDTGYAQARERLDQDDAAGAATLFRTALSARPPSTVSLQLMIACQEETVKGARRRAGEGSALYVLPYSLKGRPCYRVLWGLYESVDAARNAVPSLPAGLLEGTAPIPVSLARLIPAG